MITKKQVIEKFNKHYAQVTVGGKLRFLNLTTGHYSNITDFRNTFLNKTIKLEKKIYNQTEVWLRSADRTIYDDVVFDPRGTPSNILNLYEGLSVEPIPGNWQLFQDHILYNICDGRRDHYEWLIQWMAQIVQEPWIKMGTAVVMRGGKGTGKSVFAETFGKLFGPYFKTLSSSDHVTNQFNSVYEQCILLCSDEAHYAGDRRHESMLKSIITAPELFIIRKGYEGSMKKSFVRLLFTTNSSWCVPCSWDERRYFILQIHNGWQKNRKKFAEMLSQMSQGGYAGMLYDLLKIKIVVDLSNPPVTNAMVDQQEQSEPSYLSFFRELWNDQDMDEWDGSFWCNDLKHDLTLYYRDHHIKAKVPSWQTFLGLIKSHGVKINQKTQEIRLIYGAGKRQYRLWFDVKSEF